VVSVPAGRFGNGISCNEYLDKVLFLKVDLLLSVHGHPESERVGAKVVSRGNDNGIGHANAELVDQKGSVGRATQNLLLDPVG